jgi:Prokaryotic phospholipase A2
MPASRLLLKVLLTVTLCVGGMAGLAIQPASAHVTTQVNGCTLSPDWIFHGPCDTHDLCYDSPSTPNTAAGRLSCDNRFLADMLYVCAVRYPTSPRYPLSYVSRNFCTSIANTYYSAVRRFGGSYFQNPRLN